MSDRRELDQLRASSIRLIREQREKIERYERRIEAVEKLYHFLNDDIDITLDEYLELLNQWEASKYE
jgi:archaellum component FlaC